jgi:hypothetical protein
MACDLHHASQALPRGIQSGRGQGIVKVVSKWVVSLQKMNLWGALKCVLGHYLVSGPNCVTFCSWNGEAWPFQGYLYTVSFIMPSVRYRGLIQRHHTPWYCLHHV